MNKSIIPKTRNRFILIFLILLSIGLYALSQTLIFKQIGIIEVDNVVCVNISSSVFSFFTGSFFALGIVIGGLCISLMHSWNVMELIDRIENPLFANQVIFWVKEKIKINDWNKFIEKERKGK